MLKNVKKTDFFSQKALHTFESGFKSCENEPKPIEF